MTFNAWLDRLRGLPHWDESVIWALDLETSGLHAGSDRILSVGMVPIRGGIIRYGERFHSLVRPAGRERLSTEGLGAHHILPGELDDAPAVGAVVPEIDRRLREGFLLLHFAPLDLAFLRDAYRRSGVAWPRPRVIDTVALLARLHRRQQQWVPYPPPLETALPRARATVGLPPHEHHDALSDALATAELFLALRSRLGLVTLKSSFN